VSPKIIKNSIVLAAGQLISRAIGFLYFIFLARNLLVSSFGIYAWVLGFVYNFLPVADFGLERYILKYVPRNRSKTSFYFKRILGLKSVLAIFAIFACLVLALVLGISSSKFILLLIFAFHLIPYNIAHTIITFQNAKEETMTCAKFNIYYSLLGAILGVFVIKLKLGLPWVFGAYFAAISLVLIWLVTKKNVLKIGFIFDRNFFKKVLKESWIYALLVIMAVFYLRIPLILTGILAGDYWAGIYGSASKFIEAGILIPQAIALALAPSYSILLEKKKKELGKVYLKNMFTVFLLALPIVLLMFFAGQPIILLIYGQAYSSAITTFSLLGVVMGLLFLNSLAGNIIQNSQEVRKFIPYAFLKFFTVTAACLFLIPKMGIIGGAWAMIGGEIFGLVINNTFIFKILREKDQTFFKI